MKYKIIFMIINMNIGGTEKALLSMLSEIDKEKYDVTVMMLEEYGGFLDDIPKWVKIKYLNNFGNIRGMVENPPLITASKFFKEGNFVKGFNLLFLHGISKITKERTQFLKYILKDYPCIDEEYDLAVAYAGPMDFISYFVATKIKSKKKVQWIHFDITKIGFNKTFAKKIYDKFDKIFVVSNDAKIILQNEVPKIKNKIEVFYNIISSSNIREMGDRDRGFDDDFKGIRILTVGRLTKQKGQDIAANIVYKLKQDGYNVRWYFIGEGSMRNECENLVIKYKIENNYILLGSKLNPYPYMKSCNIYAQPSRHEGYCITLAEARCFDNPIVATNFTGAREQIINEKTGLIVNIDENEIYEAIKRLLDNKELNQQIKENLKNEVVDSTKEMGKLYKLIEDIK